MSRPATNKRRRPRRRDRQTGNAASGRTRLEPYRRACRRLRPRTSRQQPRGAGQAPLRRAGPSRRWSVAGHAICGSFMRKIAVEMSRNPPLAIFLEAPLDEQTERRRHRGRKHAPIRFAAEHRRKRVGHVVLHERGLPCQHLEQHAPERPDVRAFIDGLVRAPARGSCTPPCRGSRPPGSSPVR